MTTQTTSRPATGQEAGAGANQQNISEATAFARRARRKWWRNALCRWQANARIGREIAAFHSLPDRTLRDIGISRMDIFMAAQKSFQQHKS